MKNCFNDYERKNIEAELYVIHLNRASCLRNTEHHGHLGTLEIQFL